MTEEQKNKDFIQLYRNHIDDISRLARENGRAYDLFMLLIKHMDGTNALAVSMVALTEIIGLSRQSVSKSIKYLKDNGWIDVLKTGSSNVYIVNPDVAWTSYGNQKQYCKFRANVLLASSENAEYLNNPKATTHFKTVDKEFMKSVQANREQFEKECEVIKAMQLKPLENQNTTFQGYFFKSSKDFIHVNGTGATNGSEDKELT